MSRVLLVLLFVVSMSGIAGNVVSAQGTAELVVTVITPSAVPCDEDIPYPYFYTTVNADGAMTGGYWACHEFPIMVVFDGSIPDCSGRSVAIGHVAVNYACPNALVEVGPSGHYCPVGILGAQCASWEKVVVGPRA